MAYNPVTTDALSAAANSNAPQLKFATWFGTGVTLDAITASTPGVDPIEYAKSTGLQIWNRPPINLS